MKLRLALLALCLIPGAALAQTGRARPAECLLVIRGVEYIRGQCLFTPLDTAGTFQIAGMNGKYFAQVSVWSKGQGTGYWNGEAYANHAHTNLGDVVREDACWVNDQVSICAW